MSLPKLAVSRTSFPGLQEPDILETDHAFRIFVYFPHVKAPPWASEPPVHGATGTPRAEAEQVTPVQQSALQAGSHGDSRASLTLHLETFLIF